jgi:hypothetical protein
MLKNLKKVSIVSLLLLISGCNTLSPGRQWPDSLPERKIFVDKFLSNRNIEFGSASKIETHLTWIIRFYQGTVLYPSGWNSISERFLASINNTTEKKKMTSRLRSLGILIANEWAQDNKVRRINNSNVAVWGSALRTSAERNDQSDYVDRVEHDVKALINGSLLSDSISYARYYPEEDFDDF